MNAVVEVQRVVKAELAAAGARRVTVALSGGLDSTVLVHAAASVLAHAPEAPRALHVNHQLHVDSRHWARHCERLCRNLGVELEVHDVEVAEAGSVEAAARASRYAVFAERVGFDGLLLLGHHRDDQGETVLFKLLRGALGSLGGMPVTRQIGAGRLLRPLLDIPRSTLERYARCVGLDWLDDPGNVDQAHDRNFLRHRVLPILRTRWPDAMRSVTRQAAAWSEDAELLGTLLTAELDRASAGETLNIDALRAFPRSDRLLRHWLESRGVFGTRERALAELLRQLEAGNGDPELRVGSGLAVRCAAGHLLLVPQDPPLDSWRDVTWDLGAPLRLPHGMLSARFGGSRGLRAGPVRVGLRKGGERLRPGPDSPTRPVKDLLREARVPAWQRRRYPLLFRGDALVAVPGVAADCSWWPTGMNEQGWRVDWQPAGYPDAVND